MSGLKLWIIIVGALNVLAGGVLALGQVEPNFQIPPWCVAVAYLLQIVTVYVLAQLRGWSDPQTSPVVPTSKG